MTTWAWSKYALLHQSSQIKWCSWPHKRLLCSATCARWFLYHHSHLSLTGNSPSLDPRCWNHTAFGSNPEISFITAQTGRYEFFLPDVEIFVVLGGLGKLLNRLELKWCVGTILAQAASQAGFRNVNDFFWLQLFEQSESNFDIWMKLLESVSLLKSC